MPKALLLDLDGTLVDSRSDIALGVNCTRSELGYPPLEEARVVGFVGDGVRNLLRRALPECPGRLEEALEINRRHYARHLLDRTRLYPGVAPALEALKDLGFRLAVVTNKPREFTLPILQGLGIAGAFSAVVAGGDCPGLKPDPQALLLALERCGCEVEGSWIAGDHRTDLEAGRRAGLRRCLCRYGFGHPGEETWDLAVDRFPDLGRALASLGK